MSFVKDTFFGGAEKKAAKAQTKALEQAQTFTREGVAQARGDIMNLFPQAQQNIQQGFQGALDVFGQSLPQQTAAFTGGNVAAQQALLAGLPQQQAAILGGQTALQPLNVQPFQFQPDLSFAQQQLPSFAPQEEEQAAPQQPAIDIGQFLGGFNRPNFGGLGGAGGFNQFAGGRFNNRRIP